MVAHVDKKLSGVGARLVPAARRGEEDGHARAAKAMETVSAEKFTKYVTLAPSVQNPPKKQAAGTAAIPRTPHERQKLLARPTIARTYVSDCPTNMPGTMAPKGTSLSQLLPLLSLEALLLHSLSLLLLLQFLLPWVIEEPRCRARACGK